MSDYPMTCCDLDCAHFNDCIVGGFHCAACGGYFCSSDIGNDGLCQLCADRRAEEESEVDDDER